MKPTVVTGCTCQYVVIACSAIWLDCNISGAGKKRNIGLRQDPCPILGSGFAKTRRNNIVYQFSLELAWPRSNNYSCVHRHCNKHVSLIPTPSARPSWSVCVPYWDQTCLLPIKHNFFFAHQQGVDITLILKMIRHWKLSKVQTNSSDHDRTNWNFINMSSVSKHHGYTFLDSRVCTLPRALMRSPNEPNFSCCFMQKYLHACKSAKMKTHILFFLLYCLLFRVSTTEPWVGKSYINLWLVTFEWVRLSTPWAPKTLIWMSSIQSIPSMICANKSVHAR